jgi:Zn-dependent peptidase ImmA (M78 family)
VADFALPGLHAAPPELFALCERFLQICRAYGALDRLPVGNRFGCRVLDIDLWPLVHNARLTKHLVNGIVVNKLLTACAHVMNNDPKAILAQRLRQARTMRGLSLRALAEALGGEVSHNALAKYEGEEMMPGSQLLGRLADVLGQPPDYFFRPFTLQLKRVRFRKRARLAGKAAEAICEQAREYFERYHEIEEVLGEARAFDEKLNIAPVKTPEDAEKAADALRKKWKLGCDPLPNFVELLEIKGIKVYEIDAESGDFDGFSAETDAGPVIVLSRHLNSNLLRKRMTGVHELAHIVLPLPDNLSEKDEEAIVRRFAGAFLLPKDTFIAEFGKIRKGISLEELIELKVNFGASILAIMMRARQLGLMSEAVFVRFWQQRGGKWRSAKCEPGDDRYKGNETHSRFRQLVLRAVAEDQITMTRGASLLRQPLTSLREELRELFV